MTNEQINKLLQAGGKRWTKGAHDRIYFNADQLGLECDYYGSGNISRATFNGERISNSYARAISQVSLYVDAVSGKIFSQTKPGYGSCDEAKAQMVRKLRELMA